MYVIKLQFNIQSAASYKCKCALQCLVSNLHLPTPTRFATNTFVTLWTAKVCAKWFLPKIIQMDFISIEFVKCSF